MPRSRSAARLSSSGDELGGRRLRAGIDLRRESRRRGTTAADAYRAGRTRRNRAAAGSAASRSRRPWRGCRPASRSRRARPRRSAMTGSVSITQHAEILERGVTRRGQLEPIGVAGLERIGAGDHVEQQRQVRGRARHRADHREVAVERQGRQGRRRVAARRHQREGRLVRIDAAVKRRHAQRAADVRAERQRTIAGGQRRRRSAGGAAGRAAEIDRDCWWCRRCRYSSASRRARAARWSCRGSRRRHP